MRCAEPFDRSCEAERARWVGLPCYSSRVANRSGGIIGILYIPLEQPDHLMRVARRQVPREAPSSRSWLRRARGFTGAAVPGTVPFALTVGASLPGGQRAERGARLARPEE